ncbi:transposase [Candidatus Magnetaquicoccus inordinatus]|uniref:transposase n=1 Tax=Candidatus Magnetaquicoccus inordinatus TaxID=2496818 RepID=UPI00187D46BC|nr:transposase [Candidatus Magnetaquicoccus inordinatus]
MTSIDSAKRACLLYSLRFRIETFFSDQKSRGFNMNKSHLRDPDRISRLLIAACLAYIWIIYLGVVAKKGGWVGVIHRTERCDLSLFQLGLKYIMNEGMEIPVAFVLSAGWEESVR